MKTSYIHTAISALLIILLGGCTQNDGHIGPIFGSWSLVAMTEDGEPIDPGVETVFSFQNEIVRVVKLVDPPFSTIDRYGNFSIADDVLTLRFQAKPTQSGSYMFVTPDWLHFPKDGNLINFDVRKLEGSRMELSLDIGGKIFGYTFKKTW